MIRNSEEKYQAKDREGSEADEMRLRERKKEECSSSSVG